MKNTRSINLRKSITNKWLRDYLYRFFRLKDKFNAEYIAVLTKLYTNDGYVSLGNKLIVNINNKHDILGYENYVTDQFELKSTDLPKKINKVYVYYIETDKDSYDKYYQDLVSNSKDINL